MEEGPGRSRKTDARSNSTDAYLRRAGVDKLDRSARKQHPGAWIRFGPHDTSTALGYQLTAVDNSPEMLSHIRGTNTVLSDIETLNLEGRFDAVLLAGCLINFPDVTTRAALLACCARHARPGGVILVERQDPDRLAAAQPGPRGEIAGVRDYVDAVRREGQLVHLTVRSKASDGEWIQSFTHELIDDWQMEQELRDAGLQLVRWINSSKNWLLAAHG